MAEGHTPGPWRVKYGPRHAPDECDITIAGDIFLLADINGPKYAHCEANARLIAAAPTMKADIDEFMRRLGPRWFLEQNWFPASADPDRATRTGDDHDQ